MSQIPIDALMRDDEEKLMEGKLVRRVGGISILLAIAALCLGISRRPSSHERWVIKTTFAGSPGRPVEVNIAKLGSLPIPRGVKLSDYNDKLLPGIFDGLKEGEFVATKGWLHLAAFSRDDSDYHLQITGTKMSGNNCVIVEIPDPRNAADPVTRDHWLRVRRFIDSLCRFRRPSQAGKILDPPVFVKVSGQLFYDLSHGNPASRGKKRMKAVTSWEIHPVWTIEARRSNDLR